MRIYFNPRSPHGERRVEADKTTIAVGISIHAPRTGSDKSSSGRRPAERRFQSTLPARGATPTPQLGGITMNISIHAPRTGSDIFGHQYVRCEPISIHAPRTGSDERPACTRKSGAYFNPRSPHGERRKTRLHKKKRSLFQSTLPARGATAPHRQTRRRPVFQSTLPARGATVMFVVLLLSFQGFQSTLPARGATWRRATKSTRPRYFNPRSPHGERP